MRRFACGDGVEKVVIEVKELNGRNQNEVKENEGKVGEGLELVEVKRKKIIKREKNVTKRGDK